MTPEVYKACQKIRYTEESLLELFTQGKMNGTIHTCVGQELASYYLIKYLNKDDYIFSNHRCHGHYLHRFDDHSSLIAELMGKKSGVCSGIGSSQHICRDGFFSNGLQGGIVPLAAGAALKNKLEKKQDLAVVFIGDGTLGEGVIYETFNIASLLEISLLIVCEDNGFAQSTRKSNAFRGSIESRCEGFGMKYIHASMWDEKNLSKSSKLAVDYSRKESKPVFFHVETYRLNSHSKSDDNRDKSEIKKYREIDPIEVFASKNKDIAKSINTDIAKKINANIESLLSEGELKLDEYLVDHFQDQENNNFFISCKNSNIDKDDRVVDRINKFFHDLLDLDNRTVFIGEDVSEPYGGAFKVSRGLSDKYPGKVFSTPISEQAIAGISNGLAITGYKPYLEIMFGDFMTLTFDQLLNHASKFYYMYDKKVSCPVVIRTPVGGGRGYGPTHSQAIEKFIVGMDCVRVVAINAYRDPYLTYSEVHRSIHPVVVIENKAGYARYINNIESDFYTLEAGKGYLDNVRIRPLDVKENLTIVTYGDNASRLTPLLDSLFEDYDALIDIHILTSLYPLSLEKVISSAEATGKVLIIEESSTPFGIGAEISAQINEKSNSIKIKRLGAMSVPIPSIRSLEESVLNFDSISNAIGSMFNDC